MTRRWIVPLLVVLLVAGALTAGVGLGVWPRPRWRELVHPSEIFSARERLELRRASFADLPGWGGDAVEAALPAFRLSCGRIAALPDAAPLGEAPGVAGTAADWRAVCAAAERLPAGDREAVQRFFESRFQPWSARNRHNPLGLFTGYYEPLLHGSRKRHGRYTVPLYGRPPDLVTVDLGRFRGDLRGTRIAGKVEQGALVPFADRKAIDGGALAGRKLEIVWVDDPVDAFFLQVQGSGRIELAEGGRIRVGYAAQNGHPYTSIGKVLIQAGALSPETVSLQTLRAWLSAHPAETDRILEKNASYVFFQEVKGEGPMGAEGVPLTAGRSLAVDLKYLPLGVPVWLASGRPAATPGKPDRKLRRLLVAQDTGGAIRGPVRGDVFWGFGSEAESLAGRMKHRGKLWLLLPKGIDPQPPAAR